MAQFKIPQFQPYLDEKEYEGIKSCFEMNWITEGPKSQEFVDIITSTCLMDSQKYSTQ